MRSQLPAIVADRPVMLAYLHGSVASGCALPFSDVDVALVLEPACSLSSYARIQLEFAIAAEIESRCHVGEGDVRCIAEAPLMVQGQVVTEGILVDCRDDDFRVKFEVQARMRYFDFLPVAELMRKAFLDSLRREELRYGRKKT